MRRSVVALALVSTLLSGCALTGDVSGNRVVAYFEDAGDLVVGATVQMFDVEVGLVTDISFVTRDGLMLAEVAAAIDTEVEVPVEGLEAVIRQTSLLGEQFMELVPDVHGPPFLGDEPVTVDVADTTRRVDVEAFLSDLSAFIGSGALEDLNRFTHAQALILEGRGERFGQVLEELETFTGVLADRKLDVGAAITSLSSASSTLAANTGTLGSFLDSLEDANVLLADQGDDFRRLLASLQRFGSVSSRFLVRHEDAIDRGFKALRPVLRAIAGADRELRADIVGLARFLELFPRSLGGGPGGTGKGDYIQVEAVLCEVLEECNTRGEKGDVPGQGQGR